MEYKTRKWHDKCFQCVVCKSLVGSKPFIIPNETDVYCVSCFEEKFATKCTKCKKIMTTGGVTFKNEVGTSQQCGNFRIFLSLFRFDVKSILQSLEVLKLPFFAILGILNFLNMVNFNLQKVCKNS